MITFIILHIWVGKIAQFVNCLLCKPEDLLWLQNMNSKEPDMEICAYNPNSGEIQMNSYLWLTGTSPDYLLSSRPVKALSQKNYLNADIP